ncbi:type II toxin-antitoxin system ParD family antitoxin [Mesorhizobium sp. CAU 1732]|uniref:ribbon-helix-helix domain-containing protein n=1 Tax=Mesorhizobium sp. CAU 1732 TaxID=3140358 RepID=UPI0032616603
MGHIDKHGITLSPEHATVVEEAVEAGEFASPDAVVEEALREWKERRDNFGYSVDELRKLVQEGIDSGPGVYRSMDEIKEEARRRWEARRSA